MATPRAAQAVAFGTETHKITCWINRKMLKATLRGTDGPNAKVVVRTGLLIVAVREFVFAYPDEIDLRKVEK
jgi:hypothetical protein